MPQTTTLEQARTIIEHQLQLRWTQPALANSLPPLMLWGAPGVGKSTLIRQLCEQHQIDFVDIRLAQREPVDLRGLPVAREDAVHWLLSSEWPRDPDSRGIILFDELTAADRTLQVAAYELILDRRLGDLYQVPDGWMICAAGNRGEDRAVALTLSSALANRFCHLALEPCLQTWLTWAREQQLAPAVSAFLRLRPHCFFDMAGDLERGWPSPRSWERVALLVQHRQGLDEEALKLMIHGLIGEGAATEFLGFMHWADALPDVAALLRGEVDITLPTRADQLHVLCSALAHHLWQDSVADQGQRLRVFLRVTARMSTDFATMAMMEALEGSSADISLQRTEAILAHPDFAGWRQRHGTLLAETQQRQLQQKQEAAETGLLADSV